MNIPWKIKSKIFSIIDFFNFNSLLYFIQKYVTKRSHISNLEINENWIRHERTLIENCCTYFVFEFGGGKNLAQNLFLSTILERQLVVDLNPMIDIKLVNISRHLLSSKIKFKSSLDIKSLNDLENYGIEYKSPFDASKTNLADKCLDACISTNTLEHIPKESIKAIFKELHRVLKDTGIVSAIIDYTDHYAHTDSSITLLNYLKFSEADWKKYNHNCHFQNRLRHNDYRIIFSDCGFHVVKEDLIFKEENISDDLIKKYLNHDLNWRATSAHFVLRKVLF